MRWAAVLLVTGLFAGCLGATPGEGDDTDSALDRGEGWPWPTGKEWPAGLAGPFSLREILVAPVERDGVSLNGWVLLPDLPAGVGAPVVLEMGPYFDGEDRPTGSTEMVSVQEPSKPLDWVAQGYAVAYYSVRGTGRSTGCFDDGGINEQLDVVAVVEWLASQPWSNGRVGMMGLSYPGTTPIEAAIHNPKGLAAVAVIGTMVDRQWFWQTPQHEPIVAGGYFGVLYTSRVTVRPSADAGGPVRESERACEQTLASLQGGSSLWYSDDHGGAYWGERRYRDHLPNATAALFLQQGFDDARNSGHMYQDMVLWQLMPGPKRMFEGQWGHETPPEANIQRAYPGQTYTDLTMEWFDYWLKGIGTAADAGVGRAEFEDGTGAWHRSTSWPPAEAVDTELFLGSDNLLHPDAGEGTLTFQASPNFDDDSLSCSSPIGPGDLAFVTGPAQGDVLVAGNPTLDLLLESSGPSGSVTATLYVVEGWDGGPCRSGSWSDVSWAGANIRFHAGGDVGSDFPSTPSPLHLDLSDLAEVIPDGARLGLWITGQGLFNRPPAAYPEYTIHGGAQSVLTLPLAVGSFAAP